jgi:hypothetical protein
MSIGMLFWVIMIVLLVTDFLVYWPAGPHPFGGRVVLWVLLFLLGWKVFGFPIHG